MNTMKWGSRVVLLPVWFLALQTDGIAGDQLRADSNEPLLNTYQQVLRLVIENYADPEEREGSSTLPFMGCSTL